MEERENIQQDAPRTEDAGIDNGAALDPRASTGHAQLDEVNARILKLQQDKDAIIEELRKVNAERQTLAASAIWSQKVGDMNEAELKALEEAIHARQSNTQRVGVNGIESREGVNGQNNVE